MPSKREVEEYKMLSDEALQRFRIFCAAGKYPRPDHKSQGAFDQARRMAHDENIDHGTLRTLLQEIEDQFGGDAAGEFMKFCHKRWPGSMGDVTGDFADEDADENEDPWRSWRRGGGGEVEAQDDVFNSSEAGGQASRPGPAPFFGQPQPGGKLRGYDRAFPETQRIGMDAYPCMMNGNPTTIPRSPLNRLAFDSKTARRVDRELSDAEDYAARWPDTQRIGLL